MMGLNRSTVSLISALLAVLIEGAVAEEETDLTVRAYAAGYKAAFTCSATFNGGKTPEQIDAQELTGIYPLVAETVSSLPVLVDREAYRVSVVYDEGLPPRISQWRPHLGCTQLPVGADATTVGTLPQVVVTPPERDDGAPWARIPAAYGSADHSALASLVNRAMTVPDYGTDAVTTALLVATPEEILIESYADGFDHRTSQRTWSVAKSIAASVIGAAVEQGILQVGEPTGIARWQDPMDPRRGITLENLLHMASGLDSNRAGNRTDRLYMGGGRVEDTALGAALEARPGVRWKYANNDTLLAVRTLRESIADDRAYLAYPFEALFHRIGMLDTVPEVDWGGNFVLSSQVWTTSRDLARLGVLYLNDGVWQGERILPEGWTRYVSTPAPSQPPAARSDGRAIEGYGAQFWLYNERFPELPNDAFTAIGNRGQYLLIIPSENLVIVRRGYDPAGGEGFRMHQFAADVLAALKD